MSPQQFRALGEIVPNLFEQGGGRLAIERNAKGRVRRAVTPTGLTLSAGVVNRMLSKRLVTEDGEPTPLAAELYVDRLARGEP